MRLQQRATRTATMSGRWAPRPSAPSATARAASRHRTAAPSTAPRKVVCQSRPIAELCTNEQKVSQGRRLLSTAIAGATVQALWPRQALALDAREATKLFLRPKAVTPDVALVQLLDARGTALEIENLAKTPMDSEERFNARAILPGMAAALRKVQDAAPTALTLVSSEVEAQIGGRYGGDSGEKGPLDEVYQTVGRVLTISGRTIKADALEEGSQLGGNAAGAIDTFLALMPKEDLQKAQEFRKARAAKM